MNSLPKTVTRQRRGCYLNPGPTAPESSTLTTRLPSHHVVTEVDSDVIIAIGAEFHRAMVATAPGEKLLTGRRPVRNWTSRTISSLFLCRKLHFRKNQQKLLPPELHFLTPICTKSFVGWDFAPDPTGGGYSAPPDPLVV